MPSPRTLTTRPSSTRRICALTMGVLMIVTSCATRSGIDTRGASSDAPAAERAQSDARRDADERPSAAEPTTETHAALVERLSATIDRSSAVQEIEPVLVDGRVAIGVFRAVGSRDDAGGSSIGSETALGLYSTPDGVLLVSDQPLFSPLVVANSPDEVVAFSPIALNSGPEAHGLKLKVATAQDEELVLAIARDGTAPYVLRLPISTVSRAALRDLDGDGLKELARVSVVYDAQGRREVIVDALRWRDGRFQHVGSVSLLQRLNAALDDLEVNLVEGASPRWLEAVTSALTPIEGAPPVDALLPATFVQVPRIAELAVDLDRESWDFFHEIAIEGNLYRMRIHLEANPLVQTPAYIYGIEGL